VGLTLLNVGTLARPQLDLSSIGTCNPTTPMNNEKQLSEASRVGTNLAARFEVNCINAHRPNVPMIADLKAMLIKVRLAGCSGGKASAAQG
jgi:hypothetical protein